MEAIVANNGNLHALRLKPGMDVLEEIQKYCEKEKIYNGYISTGIGSLEGARFFDPVPLPGKKCGYGYGEPIQLVGPIELISVNGMICNNTKEEILLHIHCCFSDMNGNAYAGHLIPGNKVLMTVDLLITEVNGINMRREFDKDLEVEIFHPENV